MPTVVREQEIVIEDREELIFMLSEAATLEHMVMCGYLYAAFSMKHEKGQGLDSNGLKLVGQWDRAVSQVAVQEMLHLSLVNNLLTSIGAAPTSCDPTSPSARSTSPRRCRWSCSPLASRRCATSCTSSDPKVRPCKMRGRSRGTFGGPRSATTWSSCLRGRSSRRSATSTGASNGGSSVWPTRVRREAVVRRFDADPGDRGDVRLAGTGDGARPKIGGKGGRDDNHRGGRCEG